MYKVKNKHVVSNNVQNHNFFYNDRMNTSQMHTCANFQKNLTKAFGADKLGQTKKKPRDNPKDARNIKIQTGKSQMG